METKNLGEKITSIFGKILIAVIIIFYFIRMLQANLDLSDNYYSLFMDEQITFDGVKKIIEPSSLNLNFIKSLVMGDDHRYGKIHFDLSAIVSFFPHFFFGEKGQIIATRTFMVILLLASYILLILTFIRSDILRAIGLILLILLPSTVYYSYMPKPEPVQLFFLSLFLFFFKKNSFKYGWYFIFLGFSFAAKISIFPILPFLFAYPLFNTGEFNYYINEFISLIKNFFLSLKKYSIKFLKIRGLTYYILLAFILTLCFSSLIKVKNIKNGHYLTTLEIVLDNLNDDSLIVKRLGFGNKINDINKIDNKFVIKKSFTKKILISSDKVEGISIINDGVIYHYSKNDLLKYNDEFFTINIPSHRLPLLGEVINWKGNRYFITDTVLFALILLVVLILTANIYFIMSEVIKNSKINSYDRLFLIFQSIKYFTIGLVLGNPIIIFNPGNYLRQTFLNTKHGADNTAINILSWLRFFVKEYINIPLTLFFIILFVFILVFLYQLKNMKKEKKWNALLLLLCGSTMVFIIMFKVKRLWGFYLHPGLVLLVPALLIIIENIKQKPVKYIMTFLLLTTMPFGFKVFNSSIDALSSRTNTTQYIAKIKQYKFVLNMLDNLYTKMDKTIFGYRNASMCSIPENTRYQIKPIFGFFINWKKNPDLVILLETDINPLRYVSNTGEEYSNAKESSILFDDYVNKRKDYIEYNAGNEYGLFIYLRKDLYQKLLKE